MLRTSSMLALGTALTLLGVGTVHAQDGSIPPMVKTQGSVQYACGGIGSDESTAMRAAMKDYPLSLLFSTRDGAYLASVDVEIAGSAGSAHFKAQGPICLIKLPAGPYAVKATVPGQDSQSRNVTIGGEGKMLDFRY